MSIAALPTLTAALLKIALPPATVSVPAPTVTGPLNVFEPANVNSAPPCFTSSNAPLTLPPSVTALATVNCVLAASETDPARVRAPELIASPRVSEPERTAAFARVRAVAELPASLPPVNRSVPVPSAAASPTKMAPACNPTPPLKVFAAPKVSVEVPVFVTAPLPLITPLNPEAVVPLMVSVLPWRFTRPAPFKLSTCSEAASFKVAPPATLTGTLSEMADPPASVSIPWVTLADPLNTLAPERTNSAMPALVKPFVPLTTPLNVALLTTVSAAPVPSFTEPESVSTPEFVESPSVSAPLSSAVLLNERAAVESLETRPPPSRRLPVPNAELFPACSAPAVWMIPPLKLLVPVRVSTEAPLFTKTPLPLMDPPKLLPVAPFKVSVLPCRLIPPKPETVAISCEFASFNAPAEPIVTAIEVGSALPPASVKVPPITAVVPPNTLVPLNVNSDDPALMKLKAPLNGPFKFTGLHTFTVAFPVNADAPLRVSVPEFNASPIETTPVRFNPFDITRATLESLVTIPPDIVNTPAPSAVLLPIRTVPELTDTPPLNVLLPDSASTEFPVFTRDPVPVTVPAYTEASVPPIVRALPCSERTPAPFTLEICWAVASFSVAAVPTVTGVVFNKAAPPASVSVPALTEVAPVNVFSPASVNSEEPPLVIP